MSGKVLNVVSIVLGSVAILMNACSRVFPTFLQKKSVVGLNANIDIASVNGLQAALDGKANVDHQHEIGNVNGLQDALDAKANA